MNSPAIGASGRRQRPTSTVLSSASTQRRKIGMCRLTVGIATPASAAAGRNVREKTSMWRLTVAERGSCGPPQMNIELQKLDHRGVRHSAALAHGLQAIVD